MQLVKLLIDLFRHIGTSESLSEKATSRKTQYLHACNKISHHAQLITLAALGLV